MKKSILISIVFFLAVFFTTSNAFATTVRVHLSNNESGNEVALQAFDGDDYGDVGYATDLGGGWYSFEFDIPPGQYYRIRVNDQTKNIQVDDQQQQDIEFGM